MQVERDGVRRQTVDQYEWRGENELLVQRWKDVSAEAEEERTAECRRSAVWIYWKAGMTKPVGSDKT